MNVFQTIVNSPLIEKLGWCLMHSLWQIAVIGLLVKIALDMVGSRDRNSSVIRYAVAYAGLMVAFVVPVATWSMLESPAIQSSVAKASVADPFEASSDGWSNQGALHADRGTVDNQRHSLTSVMANPLANSRLPVDQASANSPLVPAFDSTISNPIQHHNPSWFSIFACCWLVGVFVFALRPMIGVFSARRLLKAERESVPSWLPENLEFLKGLVGISAKVQVACSRIVDVPTLSGFLRPVIFLPVSCLTNLTSDELQAILLHELAHVKRHDQLANFIQAIVETLLFFHPVVWWISRVVRQERENCCDDLAVSVCQNSRTLVSALLSLEERRSNPGGVTVLAADGGSLLTRIKRLVEPANEARKLPGSLFTSVIVLVLMIGIVVSANKNRVVAESPTFSDEVASQTSSESFDAPFDVQEETNSDVKVNSDAATIDDGESIEIISLNEFYAWETVRSTEKRLIYRFWNIFTPELREQKGEAVESWAPDLRVKISRLVAGELQEVTVEVSLQSGFMWSVGNGA